MWLRRRGAHKIRVDRTRSASYYCHGNVAKTPLSYTTTIAFVTAGPARPRSNMTPAQVTAIIMNKLLISLALVAASATAQSSTRGKGLKSSDLDEHRRRLSGKSGGKSGAKGKGGKSGGWGDEDEDEECSCDTVYDELEVCEKYSTDLEDNLDAVQGECDAAAKDCENQNEECSNAIEMCQAEQKQCSAELKNCESSNAEAIAALDDQVDLLTVQLDKCRDGQGSHDEMISKYQDTVKYLSEQLATCQADQKEKAEGIATLKEEKEAAAQKAEFLQTQLAKANVDAVEASEKSAQALR